MTSTAATRPAPAMPPKPRLLDSIAAHGVRRRLNALHTGRITVVENGNARHFGGPAQTSALDAVMYVHDARFWSEIAYGGSIGAGEAYMLGFWSTDDLTKLLRILLRNRSVLDAMESGAARLAAPLNKLLHRFNRNTRAGSRRNIAAHYDLGNDLFQLFLDPSMMYSCAIFDPPQLTLEQAQIARLDRICRKLALTPADHLLEIGTGWGAMAIHAARHYGCRVTTTTISRAQFELARARIAAAGLADRITLLLDDYRALRGSYDKLVSIEMVEAVGHQFFETYFARCGALLRDDGLMLLQAITIADQRYEAARRSVDFIQRYIFPGSTIPSVTALLDAATAASDLRLVHLEDIGPHYATTLRLWRENFLRNRETVSALGYDLAFQRMWEYYLCYCEAGFEERALGDAQMLLAKPGHRGAPLTPPLQAR